LFQGREPDVPSWFQAYGVFLGQALKKDADFRAIFTADRLADVLSEAIDLREAVDNFITESDRRHNELMSAMARIGDQIQTVPSALGSVKRNTDIILENQKRLEHLVMDAAGGGFSAIKAVHEIRDLLRSGIPEIDGFGAERLPTLVNYIIRHVRENTPDTKDWLIKAIKTARIEETIEKQRHS
jgi:hypothetical protein